MKRILLATAALLALGTVAVAQQGGPGAPGRGPAYGMGPGAMMQQLDTNGDGAISAEEFAAHRQTIFDQLDTDKSGTISQDEFTATKGVGPGAQAGNTFRDQRRAQMHAQMFTTFDTNGDGVLNTEEWADHQGRGRMLGTLDTDKDGALSAEELSQMPMGRGMGPGQGMGPRGGQGQ